MDHITEEQTLGHDWQRRTHFDAAESVDLFDERFHALMSIWRARRDAVGAVLYDDLVSYFPRLARVSVCDDNPMNFRYITHLGGSLGFDDASTHIASGRVLGEHISKVHRDGVGRDYLMCKLTAKPTLTEIEQEIRGGEPEIRAADGAARPNAVAQ